MRSVKAPDPNTKEPRLIAPPNSCDTHLHVYGPSEFYPLAPERNYTPDPRSTLDDYLKVHRALGLTRAVIVTGSANGTNNQITLDTLARMNGSFKAIALLGADVSDAELHRLKAGGFSGFRIKSSGRGYTLLKDTQRMVERTREFDWHVEFMVQSLQEAIATAAFLSSLKVPYVFDHVAHAEPDQHKHGRKEFAELLAILKNEEHAWINLYSFYQLSKSGSPDYADMVEVIQAIIAVRPDHVIWGSNWPHPSISVPTPNDGDLLNFLLAAAPEEHARTRILSGNPAKLYGWL